MRTNILRRATVIFTILMMLFVPLVVSNAGANGAGSTVVNIPFDFYVAGKTLPAGEYVIQRSTLVSADGLMIKSKDAGAGVFVLTTTVSANGRQPDSRLVFNRYKDQYFLAQYWTSGEASGRELVKSSRERTVESELAKAGSTPERIAIRIAQK